GMARERAHAVSGVLHDLFNPRKTPHGTRLLGYGRQVSQTPAGGVPGFFSAGRAKRMVSRKLGPMEAQLLLELARETAAIEKIAQAVPEFRHDSRSTRAMAAA